MNSKRYIVGIVFVSLLIWGPIDHSWPLWLLIRISYIILIPVLIWFLLKWIWIFWKPSVEFDDKFERALFSATSGVLLVLACLEATAKYHVDNTLWVRTRDGMEAVGDDIIRQGANWGAVITFFILALIAFWYSISKRDPKK